MGQLLAYLNPVVEVPLDFEAKLNPPNDAYQLGESTLESIAELRAYVEKYKGNEEHVRKAMANMNDEAVRREAFQAMFPNVNAIKKFHALSKKVDRTVISLLQQILVSPEDILSNGPLLVMLAKVLEGVFLFDCEKMNKPAIQNDFSFYRRELGKNANTPGIPVDDSEASAISMFIAQASPLLHSLSGTLSGFAKSKSQCSPFLAMYANILTGNVSIHKKSEKFSDKVLQTLHLAMVITITLYDRVDSNGAFAKGCIIDVKKCISLLKAWDNPNKDFALSTLQYSTKTFSRAPNNIRKLFP